MNDTGMKQKIQNSIHVFQKSGVSEAALRLFQTLSYNTSRQNPFPQKTFQTFKESFLEGDTRFNEDRALVKEWQSVDLLFQLSCDEMKSQHGLFDTRQVDHTIIETYLFFVIELNQSEYSRTKLAQITREINKVFPMPVMVLFKYGSLLTLAVINRRLHKQDERKDVLEKVTLIKDISIEQPHRAHIEILFDLSFDELLRKFKFTNFVELHNAWQKTLDTKELNKRFFKELANWYFYSQQWVSFPKDKRTTDEKNIQLNLIRLITRLIFVWFLKEKKLIRDEIFNGSFLKKVVKDFNPNSETTKNFYPAMLQNLFFATLNQHINKRDFARDDEKFNKADQGVKSLYRYPEKFLIDKKEVIELFKDVPFLNGGLFDCLDRFDEEKLEKGVKDQIFVDGFTRVARHIPVVPDFLFFGSKTNIDLTSFYGDKKRQKEQFKGLISIFNDYKFTIEENTPIEEEIALDPELLGKVFENLLAYYTPETETTARKQTGSFYTPREIVNYMVDESLVAYLKNQLLNINPAFVDFGKSQFKLFANGRARQQLGFMETVNKSRWQGKEPDLEHALRHLIHYNNDPHPFSEAEVQQLIFAIDHCKILDPACGSGAFPMGMLHKLVYLLGKLDPEDVTGNTRWRSLQKQKAEIAISDALNEKDKQQREQKLIEINDAFENNASDYGRKLYLIENCIYGVDIQPIAVQISKLRFFISLVVDQQEKTGAPNRGIRPLPNLETKFVAANTLIGLEKPAQLPIGYEAISSLQKQLQSIRHQHFEAKTRQEKLHCQKEDKRIRKLISDKLIALGFPNNDALKIAGFDIYDQNAAASWFEPEWMFGNDLKQGFDVVIGNPPYIDIKGLPKEEVKLYFKIFSTTENRINLYAIFIEKAFALLNQNGKLVFINPNSILINESYKKIRKHIIDGVEKIIKLPDSVFEAAVVETIILLTSKKSKNENVEGIYFSKHDLIDFNCLNFNLFKRTEWKNDSESRFNIFSDNKVTQLLKLIEHSSEPLEKFISTSLGITPYDKYKGHSEKLITKREFHSTKKLSKQYVPLISGKNIHHYYITDGVEEYLKYGEWLGAPREKKFFEHPKIIVRQIVSGNNLKIVAGYSEKQHYFTQIGFSLISKTGDKERLKFILCLLNSMLLCFYHKNKFLDIEKVVFQKILIANCKLLPIKLTEYQNLFSIVAGYLIFLADSNISKTSFFKSLIDAMVYELYFPEEIKAANSDVLKHLTNLPELQADWSEEQKLATIERVYNELSHPTHPVSIAMERQKTVPEVRIIEGLK